MSLDDQARLPPLAAYDEVAEKQRLADMKTFRHYLVETGTVKSLVELFKHTAKKEMRLDNPKILIEFLATHVEDMKRMQEIERLSEENSTLKDRQVDLQAQAEAMADELDGQKRLAVGKSLWRCLVSAEFWDGQLDEDARAAGLPVSLLYQRLCGQKLDKATKKVLVNLLRPASHDEKELVDAPPMSLDAFSRWIAMDIPEHLHDWCRDDLLPRFSAVPVPNEAPYERDLSQQIRDTGLYPDNLEQVAYVVDLDSNLLHFLDVAAETFRF